MKFIFLVQGEGRGHMTQAISLYQLLIAHGHSVSHIIVGKSKRRELPYFFKNAFEAPLVKLNSPNFLTDRKSKSISIFKTLIFNLGRIPTYLKSINELHKIVEAEQPHAIINFYDFLGGLYFLVKNPKTKHVAIAHQFLLSHSEFEFPKGRLYDKISLLAGNRLAGFGAQKKLCLSFRYMKNEPKKNLYVVPPLLRKEVKNVKTTQEKFFLVYMVNHGYSEQVHTFHQKHPEIPIHCFWDKKGAPEELKEDDNLTFHRLDDKKFIEYMSACKGYLTTAGFESVCEAMYLGKPVLMVPVKRHYEQSCNALDAKKAGAGISSKVFDLELLLDYIPSYRDVKKDFGDWCENTECQFLSHLVVEQNPN